MSNFRSTDAGINGVGFCFWSLPLAQGQDCRSAQQLIDCAEVAQGFAAAPAKHSGIWDSWITSPKSSAMNDFVLITYVRLTYIKAIPTFISFFEAFHSGSSISNVPIFFSNGMITLDYGAGCFKGIALDNRQTKSNLFSR